MLIGKDVVLEVAIEMNPVSIRSVMLSEDIKSIVSCDLTPGRRRSEISQTNKQSNKG